MSSFELIGGVGILGFLSPMDTEDKYAVTDPIYGIDGLRNVQSIKELNEISFERRRSGMIVGVNDGELYYKLKPSPWIFELSDWVEINFTKEIYIDKEVPLGEIDGNNFMFKLSNSPINKSEHIFLNGILQDDEYHYYMSGSTIVFNYIPPKDSRIKCSYRVY